MSSQNFGDAEQNPIQPLREFHALSFLRAYERCMEPAGQALGIPALICAAFGAEVGMKEILRQHGIAFEKKHELADLFTLLPQQHREAIRGQVSQSFPDFDAELDKANRSFVEWRYFYESPGPLNVNVKFVGTLAAAVMARLPTVGAFGTSGAP
jgi:hypothetical protein